MKKIKISCAPAGTGIGSNLGMNTVDFAIENIVKEYNLEDKVEINRPWESYFKDNKGNYPSYKERDFPLENIHYNDFKIIDDNNLPKALFYWGDFQHGLDYQVQTANRLKQVIEKKEWSIGNSKIDYLQISKDYFLLNKFYNKNELPFEVAMYGVTLFQNGLNDYLNNDYFENLKWLYNNAILSKSRESYSANMISRLRDDYENSFLGVDCALLNTKEELIGLPQNKPEEFSCYKDNIGIFFGRSTKNLSRLKLLKFINSISNKLDKSVVNISWNYFSGGLLGDNLGIYSKGIKRYHSMKGVNFTAGDILKGMSDLSLIITDTYHVAINAIALKIPVVCIYEPSPLRSRDANMGYRYAWRDKRALLFQTNNLADFLISSEDLKKSAIRKEKIENIVNLINSGSKVLDIAYSNLHAIAKNDRKLIGDLLTKLSE